MYTPALLLNTVVTTPVALFVAVTVTLDPEPLVLLILRLATHVEAVANAWIRIHIGRRAVTGSRAHLSRRQRLQLGELLGGVGRLHVEARGAEQLFGGPRCGSLHRGAPGRGEHDQGKEQSVSHGFQTAAPSSELQNGLGFPAPVLVVIFRRPPCDAASSRTVRKGRSRSLSVFRRSIASPAETITDPAGPKFMAPPPWRFT